MPETPEWAEAIEEVSAWRLAFGDRVLTPDEWDRWWFARVLAFALLTIALAVGFVIVFATQPEPPESVWAVGDALHRLAVPALGLLGLWSVFMLTYSTIAWRIAKRRVLRGE